MTLSLSTRASGTFTAAVNDSSLDVPDTPVGRVDRVSALKMVVFPLSGRPMSPICMVRTRG